MKNNFILEFYFEEEVIDKKESSSTPVVPNVGERIAIMTWENPSMSQNTTWWIIQEVRHGIWKNGTGSMLTQIVMIDVVPDPDNGSFKSSI